MTISRGQMNRQLYMGGGIMNAMPRQQYGLGSFVKKAVKKVTGAVKDVASSDIGKAALLAGAGMYAGGLGPFAGVRGAGFASNLLPSSIGSTVTNMFSKKGIQGALVKGGALAGLTGFLTSQYGIPEEEQEELLSDPAEKEKYLRMYYTNLNPNAGSDEIETFVRDNAAMGGRMGYALGGNELPSDPTTPVNPFKPKPIGPVLPNKAENVLSFEEFVESRQKFMKQESIEQLMQEYDRYLKDLKMNQLRDMVAGGGIMNRAGYALGDTASQNAMQAAGIGDVELGAQRMYDQMKMLEEGGRV